MRQLSVEFARVAVFRVKGNRLEGEYQIGLDQTTDVMNAIHWAVGDKQCDADRIGLWGSSFSGGHVVHVAARDARVKAFVSQVGAMDGR